MSSKVSYVLLRSKIPIDSEKNNPLVTSSTLFCTWGSQGASCFRSTTKEVLTTSALQIDTVVDTVGAGDTFTAGVIYGLSNGFELRDVLKFSCELAGRKVSQNGFDGLKQQMLETWPSLLSDNVATS
jgi:ketohexokinase